MTDAWIVVPPAVGVPACGPPTFEIDSGWWVTRHADVRAALTDPAFRVPAVDTGAPGTLAWLRATVSRFSPPERHTERRVIGVTALAALDPDELRQEATRRTAAALDRACEHLDVMRDLARPVPLQILAGRLGFSDPVAAGTAVGAVAAAYHPGADVTLVGRADRAVATLLALSPPAAPEVRANLIGLLVQACDATAGLIGAAAHHLLATPDRRASGVPPARKRTVARGVTADPPTREAAVDPSAREVTVDLLARVGTADLLAEVLRLDPPVRATRRVTVAAARLGGRDLPPGSPVLLRFDAANRDPEVFAEPAAFQPGRLGAGPLTFGAGERGCPGDRHALALAAGVFDVLRERCLRTDAVLRHEPHPTLRVPATLEVSVR